MKAKRILGLLLAVCVVLSAAPFAATEAAETGGITEVSTGDELREAIGAGGTVKMMADISGGLTVNTVATLDLNGFIFEGGVTINRNGVLTLTDSNPESLHDGLEYKDPTDGVTVHEVKGGVLLGGTVTVNRGQLIFLAGTLTASNGIYVNNGSVVMEGGLIAGNGSALEFEAEDGTWNNHGPVVVSGAYATFTMKGGLITCNAYRDKSVLEMQERADTGICVKNYATFTMQGGAITRNFFENGAGVFLMYDGVFNMEDGEISGNLARHGGAVGITSGTFNMTGGRIYDNTATESGGAVFTDGWLLKWFTEQEDDGYHIYTPVVKNINIKGGSIDHNQSGGSGGAILVNGMTSLEVSGGASITGNTAAGDGGGIDVSNATLTMSLDEIGVRTFDISHTVYLGDCNITGNTAGGKGGGIYLTELNSDPVIVSESENVTFHLPEAWLKIAGNTVIRNNLSGGAGAQKSDNVYLCEGAMILGDSDMTGAEVGVTTEEKPTRAKPVVFTKDLGGHGVFTNFISDDPAVGIWPTEDNEAMIGFFQYDIGIAGTQNGSVSAVAEGYPALNGIEPTTTVTVTLAANTGYEIGTLAVRTYYSSVRITSLGNGRFSFKMPAADVEITATFNGLMYTVEFVDGKGNVLQSGEVEYGAMPEYTGSKPEKEGDAQYSYEFEGWTPEIVPVTGPATYTAVFTATVNKYTVEFVDEGGNVLQSVEAEYGTMPVYTGSKPEKEGDAQYSYEFAGWTPEIKAVDGKATYTAVFTPVVNKYTVEFVNWDGSVLQSEELEFGATPGYKGSKPEKEGDAQYSYEFAGWTPEIKAVDGKATYTAVFTPVVNKYTVEFVDEDGNVLQSGEVEYGATPVYTGSKPEKEGDAQYSYEFAGWTPEIVSVTGPATYTAVFTATVNKYTVEFVDEGGNVLQSEELEYGVTPEYKGETPVKNADENNTYEFAGWSTEIKAVDGKATYTAVFNAIPKEPVNPPTGEAGLAVWAVLTVVTLSGTALFLDRNRKRAKAR